MFSIGGMMKLSKKAFVVLLLTLFSLSVLGYSQESKEKPVKIPREVAKIIEANLAQRQAQIDIPLSYFKTLYFPYQNDYFTCFFLKIKNSALGYEAATVEEKKEKAKKEEEKKVGEEQKVLSCNIDFFFRIYSLNKDGQVNKIHKEIYLLYGDQVVSENYNPDEENVYSFGTLFPPGHYLLSAAAASPDLAKIGLVFQEFYLPIPSDLEKNLELTPLLFLKSMKRMPSPDSVISLYKNLFHYSLLEVEPLFDHEFSSSEKLDIFYFILGGTPSEDGKFSFEINYVYRRGEQEVVKFQPQILDKVPAPVVSLPLDLLFADKILEPGEYTLEITVKEKVGRKEGKGKINFIIK
jgi:hypothetical protein